MRLSGPARSSNCLHFGRASARKHTRMTNSRPVSTLREGSSPPEDSSVSRNASRSKAQQEGLQDKSSGQHRSEIRLLSARGPQTFLSNDSEGPQSNRPALKLR